MRQTNCSEYIFGFMISDINPQPKDNITTLLVNADPTWSNNRTELFKKQLFTVIFQAYATQENWSAQIIHYIICNITFTNSRC